MNTPRSRAWSCIRTRSPRRAPPENGEDGSTARTPTRRSAFRSSPTSAFVEVDLPTPGDPVMPTTWAWPAWGASAAITSRSSGDSSSTSEISRATARGSPSRARATRSGTLCPSLAVDRRATSGGGDAHDQGVALAAATAQRGRADATTATLELQRQVQHDAGTGHADRVAERDRTAVDVDLLVREPELARRGDA